MYGAWFSNAFSYSCRGPEEVTLRAPASKLPLCSETETVAKLISAESGLGHKVPGFIADLERLFDVVASGT